MVEQPLRKERVTQGSQVILPAYPILFLLVAGAFIFQNDSRTQGDAFEVARMIFSIEQWGWVFLLVGSCEVFALMSHRRKQMIWMLVAGAGLSAFWACLLFGSASINDTVSWTSGMWVMFVPAAHIASVRSLARDEVRI